MRLPFVYYMPCCKKCLIKSYPGLNSLPAFEALFSLKPAIPDAGLSRRSKSDTAPAPCMGAQGKRGGVVGSTIILKSPILSAPQAGLYNLLSMSSIALILLPVSPCAALSGASMCINTKSLRLQFAERRRCLSFVIGVDITGRADLAYIHPCNMPDSFYQVDRRYHRPLTSYRCSNGCRVGRLPAPKPDSVCGVQAVFNPPLV